MYFSLLPGLPDVVCQCRRCACTNPKRDQSPIVGQTELKTLRKQCCGPSKLVRSGSDVTPNLNSLGEIEHVADEVEKIEGVDMVDVPNGVIQISQTKSSCCG